MTLIIGHALNYKNPLAMKFGCARAAVGSGHEQNKLLTLPLKYASSAKRKHMRIWNYPMYAMEKTKNSYLITPSLLNA